MNEADWLSCNSPYPMLDFLRGKVGETTVRLFACACARRAWHLMIDDRSRLAVELGEHYVESRFSPKAERKVWGKVGNAASEAALRARRRVAYPEDAGNLAFAWAAEAAGLVLSARTDNEFLRMAIESSVGALAYEAAASDARPPAEPWPSAFADEDEEAVAWVARLRAFQQTGCFLGPYRIQLALRAQQLRELVGNPFEYLIGPA